MFTLQARGCRDASSGQGRTLSPAPVDRGEALDRPSAGGVARGHALPARGRRWAGERGALAGRRSLARVTGRSCRSWSRSLAPRGSRRTPPRFSGGQRRGGCCCRRVRDPSRNRLDRTRARPASDLARSTNEGLAPGSLRAPSRERRTQEPAEASRACPRRFNGPMRGGEVALGPKSRERIPPKRDSRHLWWAMSVKSVPG